MYKTTITPLGVKQQPTEILTTNVFSLALLQLRVGWLIIQHYKKLGKIELVRQNNEDIIFTSSTHGAIIHVQTTEIPANPSIAGAY